LLKRCIIRFGCEFFHPPKGALVQSAIEMRRKTPGATQAKPACKADWLARTVQHNGSPAQFESVFPQQGDLTMKSLPTAAGCVAFPVAVPDGMRKAIASLRLSVHRQSIATS
jgi:hypothetical protein